jgi:hypothetical protein
MVRYVNWKEFAMSKPAYEADPGINFEAPVLYDADSGEAIRNATENEAARSRKAKENRPGAERGIIEVDGRECYVIDWPETKAGADRRVAGPATD